MVVQSIPLITDLRTQNRNIGILYVATGQTTPGDNNGGMYMWNPSSTAADDSFYVLQVTGVATGRWLRIGAASNIYTSDGSLINNRTVTLNGYTLNFAGSTYSSTFNADGTVSLGSLIGVGTRYVVAGPTGLLGATGTIPTPGTPTRFIETFTASAGQTTFNTANTLFTYFFDVYVNGVLLDNTSYTASANQVVLTDACTLNDIVQIIGFYNITYVGTLPPQAGNAGKFLTTDGTSLAWAPNPLGTVTSVDMSVPTGFAISGNPVTTAGTLALGFAAGYSLPANSVQANWTTAYNRSLTSAGVTGTTTKTLTLNQQDGGTITATWSDYDTAPVTSVFGRTGDVIAVDGDYDLTELGDVTVSTPSNGQVLRYNGTSWVNSTESYVGTVTNVSTNVGTTGTDINSNVLNPTTTPTININVPDASASSRGALTSTDWTTFNNKQAAISLTTVGSSGAATFIANVLNIPNYGSALSGYVPTSRTLTINGTTYDLTADRTWSVGTVTSVDFSVPTGFAIANNPITTSGTLALTFAAGYSLPTNVKQSNWDDAYTWVAAFPTQTGNTGKFLTTNGSVLSWGTVDLTAYVPKTRTLTINGTTYDLSADRTWTIVAGVSSVAGTAPISAVNASGAVTISISQSSASADGYLSSADWSTFNAKQPAGNYITSLTGEATASGPGAASVTLTNSAVIGKVLTGLNVTGGSISATDSILQAFGKIQNQINGLVGGLQYQGTWNANTNTPTLSSGVGTNGHFYIVSVAGSTNLDGITDWKVGDWAVYHASSWQKVDNTESVTSVNGFTGAVSLTTSNIPEGTNLYYTDSRARQSISLTTTGTSGAATYDNTTGVLNIPQYQGGVTSFNTRTGAITLTSSDVTTALGYTPVTNARTLTINGTTFDLTANRTWSVGTVTSVGLTMPAAFTVTNSPVTGSGTLTVAGAGTASQYIDGTGALQTFPTVVDSGALVTEVYNNSGATLTKGTIVYITGGQGNLPTVSKALATGDATSAQTFGFVRSDITNMNNGFVIVAGKLGDLNTNGLGNGTQLYLSPTTAGQWTTTKPLAPNHLVYVGIVVRDHPTQGVIEVIIQNGYELYELHDVQVGSYGTKDVLYRDTSTNLWKNIDIFTLMGAASGSANGYLTSTDWTTFNNKVPATRSLSINGVSYDLSADRSWTIGPTIYSRGLQKFTATAGQTTFTITNGYTVGLVDVYRNGVKLDNALEFTASNGTTVVLTDAAALNDVIEVYKYGSEYIPNNALRTVSTFTATAAQTTFSVTYSVGLIDVFYNGAKLAAAEYTATNGTSVVLASACVAGDIVEIIAYSYLVNGYSGISGSGNSGYIPKFTSATSIGNSLIQDNGSLVTINGTAANPTLSGGGGYVVLKQTGGYGNVAIGAYGSGSFSGWIQVSDGSGLPLRLALNPLGGSVGVLTDSPSVPFHVVGSTLITGSTTATLSIARGVNMTPTLVASANNDVLVGLDINPTFTNGAFTGVSNIALRVTGNATITGTTTLSGALTGTSATFNFFRSINNTGFLLRNDANSTNLGGLTRRSYWAGGTAADTQIFAETGYAIYLNPGGSSSIGLTLASTGAATFSSSVTALSFTSIGVSNGNGIVTVQDQDGRAAAFKSTTPIGGTASIGSTTNHDFRVNTGDVLNTLALGTKSGTNWLLFASTGAATFSSSVSATQLSINTTTTDGRIDVRPNGTSSFPIYWRNNNGGYGGGVYVTGGNNMQLYLANSAGTENVLIAASGTSFFNGGNVGIGTPSPAALLDIQGTAESLYLLRVPGASPHLRLRGANGTVSALTTSANGNRVGQVSFEPYVSSGLFLEMTGIFGVVNGTVTSTAAPTDLVFAAGSNGNIASNERMRITSGGNVGIGDNGPSSKLQIAGDVRISGTGPAIDGYDGGFFDYASSTLRIRGQNSTGGAIAFMTSANGASNVSTERMRITSGGNLEFMNGSITWGYENQGIKLSKSGVGPKISLWALSQYLYLGYAETGGWERVYAQATSGGVYLTNGATSWTANSDERLKTINSSIENAIDKILTLRAVNYSWKSDELNRKYLGLIAQDVQKVLPELVDKDEKDEINTLGIRYTEMIPVLVKAIQELKAEVDSLKNK